MILNKLEEVSNFFQYENFNESVNQGIAFFGLLKLNKDEFYPKEILDFILNDEKILDVYIEKLQNLKNKTEEYKNNLKLIVDTNKEDLKPATEEMINIVNDFKTKVYYEMLNVKKPEFYIYGGRYDDAFTEFEDILDFYKRKYQRMNQEFVKSNGDNITVLPNHKNNYILQVNWSKFAEVNGEIVDKEIATDYFVIKSMSLLIILRQLLYIKI